MICSSVNRFFMLPPLRQTLIQFRTILGEQVTLDLDPAMVPSYIQALLNDAHLLYVEGEVDELYTEVADVRERLNFLRIMDSEYLSYGKEDEA